MRIQWHSNTPYHDMRYSAKVSQVIANNLVTTLDKQMFSFPQATMNATQFFTS
jgi:hypothetical protein